MTIDVRPLSIVHMSDNYPPSLGGLERTVQALARVQVEFGHSVRVLTTELPGEPKHSRDSGVDIHRLPFLLRHLPGAFIDESHVFFPPLPDPFFERSVIRACGDNPPDIIHAHGWILYSSFRPARHFGARVIATAHDQGSVCALKTLYVDGAPCSGPAVQKCLKCAFGAYGAKGIPIATGLQLSSHLHRRVDAWTAVSSAVAEAGSAPRNHDREQMTVIPSFVPDSVINVDLESPRPDFVPREGPYILFAGVLGAHKGVGVLLAAHRLLWEAGSEIPLVLAGIPAPGESFDFSQPGVNVAQRVPHDAVMSAWVNATVGVVPSMWSEPFGLVAVECLAAGTPLVVSRVGGLADIVDGERYGLTFDRGNPAQLAEGIHRLLRDRELSARLAAAGKRRALDFTASAVGREMEKLYRRALDSRSRN